MQVDLEGHSEIPRSRPVVYAHLLDAEFVARSAPGVERVDILGDSRYLVVARFGVGPIRVKLEIEVMLTERKSPERACLEFIGKAPGTEVRGETLCTLTELDDGSRLEWRATAEVHGTLARVGARLLRSQIEKTVISFWDAFAERVEAEAA